MKLFSIASLALKIAMILTPVFAWPSELDYCNTIWFDSQAFNFPLIAKASNRENCREQPIPLHLSTKAGKINANLEIHKTVPAIPDYLNIDLDKRSGSLDFARFLYFAKKNRDFERLSLGKYATTSSIEVLNQADGVLVLSEIAFLDSFAKPRYVVADYIFFKEDRLSIFYFSKILDKQNALEMDLLENLRKTFKTMRFGW